MTTIVVLMSKPNQSKPPEPSSTTPALPDSFSSNQSEAPATSVYWRLKLATANKLGKRAEGSIHYQILADIDRHDLFISITANDSGGYFSSEVVPLAKVQACLDKYEASTPFPSKALNDAFVGLSSNNAGFLSAILRSEGVLNAAPDAGPTLSVPLSAVSMNQHQPRAVPLVVNPLDHPRQNDVRKQISWLPQHESNP